MTLPIDYGYKFRLFFCHAAFVWLSRISSQRSSVAWEREMASSNMIDVMQDVAQGSSEKVRTSDFVDTVFTSRTAAGGELPRRLLWLFFLMQSHIDADFPKEFQNADLNMLALQIINVTASTVLPNKTELLDALKTIAANAHRLEQRRRDEIKMNYRERKQRHQEIRRRADAQRAQERTTNGSEIGQEYGAVIEAACKRLLIEHASLPPQVLLAVRQALNHCIVDHDCQRRRTLGF